MDSSFADNYRYLSRYNRWFNERLYAACETLGDEERNRERGAFFGSIHHTLNHIVVGDKIWLGRLRECGLQEGIRIEALDGGVLDLPAGVKREHPAWKAMTHFFNHQTHHRGQVTALLMQAGVDVGVTDMIALA
jgi:uncharacterized damage-inducible protein DinB